MPNTIEENIERLKAVVPAIKNSIITKGGTVNSGDGLEEFADDVLSIKNELTDITITSNGEYYSGEETTLTTTTFPVTVLDAVGTPLKHVDVIGNANQSGTPTPDNPIMPQGTGERTGNWFDISNVTHQTLSPDGTISTESAMDLSGFIEVNGDFTVSWTAVRTGAYMRVSTYDTNKNYIERLTALNTYTNTHYSNSHIGYIRINYENSYGLSNIMLNTGSTPIPYQPYGYKLDISNGGENLFDQSDFTLLQVTSTLYRYGTSLGVLPQGVYTFNATKSAGAQSIYLTAKLNGVYSQTTISSLPFSFTADGNSEYIIRTANNTGTTWDAEKYSNMMINRGSTPLPYEPYQYHYTTTPTYLGEVETTRKVKKLVLTGEEAWQLWNGNYYASIIDRKGAIGTILCTHFINSSSQGISYNNQSTSGLKITSVAVPFVSDLSGLKEWLAAQYAAGTPVCVWYVLATEETAVVNEPLMKIGEYADQLSIDTNILLEQNAKNIINIDTTLKPSSASFTYNKKGTYIGYNKITVSVSDVVDGRIFIVTTIPNATVTISNTSNTYTQTADNTGDAVFENVSAGSYTITATYDDAVSDTTTITVTEHSIVEDTFATLTISASGNTTITVTNGTITKTITYTGTPIVQYVSLGTWDLSCIIDGITVTRTVSVDTYTNQDILLEPIPQTVSRYVNFTSNATTITGDPDTHPVYMGINRCNVSDDGTINAYYGDASYTEDGSNGQVMVKIPKFYYKVTPDSDGGLDGANIRKCTWEISNIPQTGFTLHPAFYDANGNEIDYFLYGAFDGVGQNSEGIYNTSYNTSSYKLSSVAGSTYVPSNLMTRATARTMAANRGTGWYQVAAKQTMAVQMLFAVEYGFNSQVAVGNGVTNASAATYAGQTTGNITSGTQNNETTPVNWRGIENFWGNIFDWIDGLNINERVPYICDGYTFVDDTSTGYTQISFSLPVSNYITALGYDSTNDWVMLPSESSSTSNPNGPIGDYVSSVAGWRVALLGGRWTAGSFAGAFCWGCAYASSGASASIGARLMYIPSAV